MPLTLPAAAVQQSPASSPAIKATAQCQMANSSPRKMKLLALFVCLFQLALSHELLYTPSYSYYAAPLAYARLIAAPLAAAQSHVYHSVQTPNSFQQQFRSDIKPLTYEYIY